MSNKIYVEGGGDSKSLRTACRKGLSRFLERAGVQGRMPRVVACGSRQNAFESFETAQAAGESQSMLLVDAEAPVKAPGPWEHLNAKDHWERPPGSADEQCHLMVQIMESWFLADRDALKAFYGKHFNVRALPVNTDIEQVSRQDVYQRLAAATRKTQKGKYNKAAHSFQLLGTLDPALVENASPYAKRFLLVLRRREPRSTR